MTQESSTVFFNQVVQKMKTDPLDLHVPSAQSSETSYSWDDLLANMNTLDDYEELISAFEVCRPYITLQFLDIFFDKMTTIEERIWQNYFGKHPDFKAYYSELCDLLLENYTDFVLKYESAVVEWIKSQGLFDDEKAREFFVRRNDIYAKYVVIAEEVIS